MGRPSSPLRTAAREAGAKTYVGYSPCMICGTNLWYTVSTGCVECVKSRAKEHYAGLDAEQKAAQRLHDQDRHMRKKSNDL